MNRRDRRAAKKKEERRAGTEHGKRRLPVAPDERSLVLRRLVRELVLHRARANEGDERLPIVAAAAAGEGVGPALAAKFEEEPRPACAKGCAYCCHLHVAVTIPEVLLAIDHARRTRDAGALDALGAAAARAADALRGTTPLTRPMVPCALLGADGACTVYAARPLACRGHHSFDVEACRLVFETRVDRKTAKRDTILLFADGAARGLRDALGELRLDGGTYELNQALAIALADPTAASRWRAGEDAFAEARAVLPDEEARALTEGRATPRT